MPITIGQNLFSLPLLRNLDRASREVSSSFEKLSSGLRINRASDDAAGLSVAEQLRVKNRILSRANLNINDGISVIDIASGTLESITTLLTRMGELAEQAANGSLGNSQRRSLDQEYQALDKELRRLSETTTFNGIELLKGDYASRAGTYVSLANASESAISSDGRYIFTAAGRRDTITGEFIARPASMEAGVMQSSASGEYLVSTYRERSYLWDVRNNRVTQLSSTTGINDYAASAISADGSTVAFSTFQQINSSGTVTGTNASASVYLYDVASGTFRTAATGLFDVFGLQLSASGSYGAVISSDALTADNSYVTMFKSVTSGSPQSSRVGEVGTAQYNTGLGVTEDGQLYLGSTYDLVGGGLGGVYRYKYATGGIEKIFEANNLRKFSMSGDGSYLTIIDEANPLGKNPSGYQQVFRYDSLTASTSQITNYGSNVLAGYTGSVLSADGNTLLADNGGSSLYSFDISPNSYRLNIETGSGTSGVIQSLLGSVTGTLRGLGSHHLTTQSGARGALDNSVKNLERLGAQKGVLGAATSRLVTASRVVRALADEVAGARSRITDADVAVESANLIRNQIVQKATASLLGQANSLPEIALQLLNQD